VHRYILSALLQMVRLVRNIVTVTLEGNQIVHTAPWLLMA
jgi:hypothetical protein